MNLEQFLDVVRLSAEKYVTLESLVRCNAIPVRGWDRLHAASLCSGGHKAPRSVLKA